MLSMFVCGALSLPNREGRPKGKLRGEPTGKSLSVLTGASVRLSEDGVNTCNSEGEAGVCYDPLNCLQVAGVFGNNCPAAKGVCCLFYRQCGQRSSQEVSYFQNADDAEGSSCNYRVVKRSSRYCQMRVNLEQLELPAECQTSINIEGIHKGNSIGKLRFPERNDDDVICSTEARKEYSFDISDLDEVRVNVNASGENSGRWKIKVTQVQCRDNEAPADLHDSHIPAVWPPPLPTHPPSHDPKPTRPPTTPTTDKPSATCWWNCPTPAKPTPAKPTPAKPTGPKPDYSQCGVKGANARSINVRSNNNNLSEGESEPFITNNEWGIPSRNDSVHVEVLRKLCDADPFCSGSGRVTFGKKAGPMEYPWQVGMKVRGRFHCGASIIGDQYILTAAHCVTKYKNSPRTLYLTLGDYDLSSPHEQANYVPIVERVTVHPQYSRTTLRNDIAVLKLTKKIPFSRNIRPVCLVQPGYDPTNKIAIVTGWGRDENNRLQSKLVELAAEVVTNSYCGGQWEKNGAPRGFITKDMMCMDPVGGDSCNGDSGGPSVHLIGGTYYQVGLVSFGSGSCVDPTLPGVYTRITSYLGWIRQQMN